MPPMRSSTSRTCVPYGLTATSRSTTNIDISTSTVSRRADVRAPAAGITAIGSTRHLAGPRRRDCVSISRRSAPPSWAPFYVATDAGVRIARALGSDVPLRIFAALYRCGLVRVGRVRVSCVVASGTDRAAVDRRRRRAGAGRVARDAAAVLHVYRAGFSHACSAFAVAAFVAPWLTSSRLDARRRLAALGALAALMGMVREQDLFIAIGPALDYASHLSHRRA